MGDKSDVKLMYSIDGKSFQKIGEPVEISHDICDSDMDDFGLNSSTMSANFMIKISKKMTRRLIEALTMNEFTNNYRKRHGQPMRRKVRQS